MKMLAAIMMTLAQFLAGQNADGCGTQIAVSADLLAVHCDRSRRGVLRALG